VTGTFLGHLGAKISAQNLLISIHKFYHKFIKINIAWGQCGVNRSRTKKLDKAPATKGYQISNVVCAKQSDS
jgi:hypothetical protein